MTFMACLVQELAADSSRADAMATRERSTLARMIMNPINIVMTPLT